jgi:hypothetical protein
MIGNAVIFSSIDVPEHTIVQESLDKFAPATKSFVITSQRFKDKWSQKNATPIIARFNSTSAWRRNLRKLLLRNIWICRILRIMTNNILRENPHFLMPPHTARHFEYFKILKEMDDNAWAILVDSRDLVFQVAPEEVIENLKHQPGVHLFLEDKYFFKDGSPQKNHLSPANWNWALQVMNLNSNDVSHLIDTDIVNAGCILGRVKDLREFFTETCRLLQNSNFSSFALLDQAAVNLVAYSEDFTFRKYIHKNGEVVLNMCGVVDGELSFDQAMLQIGNSTVPIVHQFDRFGLWTSERGFEFSKREYKVQKPSLN